MVVENGTTGELHAAEVTGIDLEPVNLSGSGVAISSSTSADTPVAHMTKISLGGAVPSWLASAAPASLTVHFGSR